MRKGFTFTEEALICEDFQLSLLCRDCFFPRYWTNATRNTDPMWSYFVCVRIVVIVFGSYKGKCLWTQWRCSSSWYSLCSEKKFLVRFILMGHCLTTYYCLILILADDNCQRTARVSVSIPSCCLQPWPRSAAWYVCLVSKMYHPEWALLGRTECRGCLWIPDFSAEMSIGIIHWGTVEV